MSVKEKPVASRYLDFVEKDKAYRKHLHTVATCRPSINMTQPDPPRRLIVAQASNDRYRKGLKKSFADRSIMIDDVRRPQTSQIGRLSLNSRSTFRSGYDDTSSYKSSARSPPIKKLLPERRPAVRRESDEVRPPERPVPSIPRRTQKIDSVKIGFGDTPIIESEEIYETTSTAVDNDSLYSYI